MSRFKHYLEAVQYAKIEEDKSLKERLTEKQFTEGQNVIEKIKSAEGDVKNLLSEYRNDSEKFWSSFRELWFYGWKSGQSEMDRQNSEFRKENNVYRVSVEGAPSASGDETRYRRTALQKHKVSFEEYDTLNSPNAKPEEVKKISGKILLNVLDAKRRNNLLNALGVLLKTNPPSWLNTRDLKVSAFKLDVPVQVKKVAVSTAQV